MFSSNSSQVSSAANFIEEVFSTYLWTGTGAARTITNDIDLSTKGGLVWIKNRNTARSHSLYDTVRGANLCLLSNLTNGNLTDTDAVNSFTSTGFTLGAENRVNASTETYVGWTFREQPKFFDVVTYSGNNAAQNIAHSLGSAPGCIIVKDTSAVTNWAVFHRSLGNAQWIKLNGTDVADPATAIFWNLTNPTSTDFSVGTALSVTGRTYVAYLFAHDAGGFGTAGTDNVISCGSYAGVGSTQQDITLGYEPQWVMIKRTDTVNSWIMVDNMRGFFQTADNALEANSSNEEAAGVSVSGAMQPTATGFHLYNANSAVNATGGTYIYIAIRRGPMKVPTLGTSVYNAIARIGTGANATVTGAGFTPDLLICADRTSNNGTRAMDRLRGPARRLDTNQADIERTPAITSFDMNGFTTPDGIANAAGVSYINWLYKRAPSFFDEVCYTGDTTARTLTHNLTVVPELMIVKNRTDLNGAQNWQVYVSALGNTSRLQLNTTDSVFTGTSIWNSTSPTASVFSLGTSAFVNGSGDTYVAYLFATCAGVSKVGSYNGNGTTQTINCGFTGGARFVLIKRTDSGSTGPWYVYDTARGMTVLTDPYLLLNSTAAEQPTLGSVTTVSTGFAVNDAILAGINAASPAAYIFLAIA